jgi:NaMN:DMB phosphoribosyltransferase
LNPQARENDTDIVLAGGHAWSAVLAGGRLIYRPEKQQQIAIRNAAAPTRPAWKG